ncbi:GNAT family N-acetyltransferase [Marinobacter sp. OP 3.4]|uniref:GNAT family N-acetyltransferase n=1 Tax=Marinobacter sp. OP 3.4 TaxID=3076501 RepID=UPI002E1E8EF0
MDNRAEAVWIRGAAKADAEAVAECVADAYGHYEERIGRPPGPMVQDYHKVVRECDVFVAVADQEIQGVLVLAQTREGFLLDNIAVNPGMQGKGVGRALLEFAEQRARSAGYDSIYLYTNALMSENRELYARIGYKEYDRRSEQGLDRVYMRKSLPRGTVDETAPDK